MVTTVDLGAAHALTDISIRWEFPAKSFSVAVSLDGSSWIVVFATDANVVSTTSTSLAAMSAAKLRVSMYETGPSTGQHQGRRLYGIREIAVLGSGVTGVVEECSKASLSEDARDKYFLNYVSELGAPSPSNPEASALVAAEVSLSSATSELQKVLATCTATQPTALQQVRSSMNSSGASVSQTFDSSVFKCSMFKCSSVQRFNVPQETEHWTFERLNIEH
eukprot:1885393-Amphidinium_carterae.1